MKRNFLHILLAFVIAFGVWVYVVTVVSPESEATYYNIPVVLNNESLLTDKGLMVSDDAQPTVMLQLRGNRSDLNNLKNSDITVIADLSKINDAGVQTLNYSISFTGNTTFEILNQYPSEITLQIAEWASKEVPVAVNYTGTLGLDYIAYKDEAQLDRNSITITGPKSVVDKITQARVDVSLDGRVESVSESYRYTLCDASGQPVDASSIKTNAAEVSLTLKIQRVKEVQLLLNVVYGGGATAENTTITLSQQTIKVSGSENMLASLGDTLTIGTVNLAEIPEDTTLTFPVNLQEGLENLSGITEVSAKITFQGLVTKTLYVTNIFVTGTPSGMKADIAAKMVEVTVRGPAGLVENISAGNLSVVINLSQAELGENLYKAQIVADTAYSEVGVIGSYNILVSVTDSTGGAE